MPELPEYMMRNGRPVDDNFRADEMLYRRVLPEDWEVDYVNVDAIEMPDMSVNRAKYGPPESVLLSFEKSRTCGVIGFTIGDVPPEKVHLGVHVYRFRVQHVPLSRNYPHSEVRAFYANMAAAEQETHITESFLKQEKARNLMPLFPLELQLRWREELRRKCRIIMQPSEEVA